MRANTLAFRLVAGAALWCVAALIAGGVVLSSVFRSSVERSFDARLDALLVGLVAASEVGADGRPALIRPLGDPRFEQPFSGWYWQIDGESGALLRSRSLWDQTLRGAPGKPAPAGERESVPGPQGQQLHVVTRRILLPGAAAPMTFRLAGDLAEVRAEVSRFNRVLAWSIAALSLALVAGMLVQVRFGLAPLRRVGQALADIRLGRADRLEGRFPGEIEPLVEELNALVEHDAAVVERARTHVGNLAHALKTPLSILANEADGKDGALAETVRRQTERMRRQVDHYLVRARTAASTRVLRARTPVAPVIDDLQRTLGRIHQGRHLAIAGDCPAGVLFRGERQDLEEMIGNLLDNACKWAASQVQVSVTLGAGQVVVRVDDDGPGLPPGEARDMLERGARFDEQMPGSGLGLAIVRDIAGLYGGSITLEASPLGGLAAILVLPAAAGPSSRVSPSARAAPPS